MRQRFTHLLAGALGAAGMLLVLGGNAFAQNSTPVLRFAAVSLKPDAAKGPAAGEAAQCPPFEARVEMGKKAEQDERFRAFHSAFEQQAGPHFAETMKSCFDVTPNPDTISFVLVADITGGGAAQSIEVKPETNIASCFAAGFAHAPFPPAPGYPDHDGFPIVIDMHISQ